MALLIIRAERFWKKTRKKIFIQGIDVAGFDKLKVECFNCHKMGHFARECRAPRSQDKGRRDNYRQGSKVEEQTPKALMAIGASWQIKKRIVCHKLKVDCSSSASENGESTGGILSKPEIKFVRPADSPIVVKTDKKETTMKSTIKYDELCRKPSKKSTVRGNQRNRNNLKPAIHRPYRPPMRPVRPNMNVAQPKRTSFHKLAHSYSKRPFQRTSVVRSQFRALRVPTVTKKIPTVNRKFPTGNTNFSTADLGNNGTAVKASACWIWKPTHNLSSKGNISYLSDYEPFDIVYVSFGQGGCKITGKGTIKTGKLEFENMYFVKDLKDFKLIDDTNVLLRTLGQHNIYSIDLNNIVPHKDLTCSLAKASADECILWHKRLGKQHKASCKTKLVNLMNKPLHTLHMDLFGPTFDETSGILRNFITEIENLKELRNGVAKKRNKTLIEAARTMLADVKLPVTFRAEAVNTACYVQNRVLVNKSQNKTPYELFNGSTPAIGFPKPFGCHVMILNTLDNLGKFKAKGDE
nr:hypothetical protein [Tanacetum cinerariifolium]